MKLLTLGTLIISLSCAKAAVTITYEFKSLRDDSGTIVDDGTLFALIASDQSNTLASDADLLGAVISEDNVIADKFRIFDVGTTQSFDPQFGIAFGTTSSLTYGTDNGDLIEGNSWALYWFTGGLTTGGTVVAGQKFGMFSSTTTDTSSGGDIATIFPTDGTLNANVFYYDTENGGGVAPASFNANQTVIPEPSAALLGLLGAGALFLRRRR